MASTHNVLEKFHSLPMGEVPSNEPYGVGNEANEADRRQEAKGDFISGTASWPEINYPLLNSKELWEAEHDLWRLLDEINADKETDATIKDVAYEQIAIKLAEVYRHLETVRGLKSAAAHQELSRERAGTMTLEIFGEPQREVIEEMLDADRRAAHHISEAENPGNRKDIANEFLDLTGDIRVSNEAANKSFELKDEAMEIIRGDLEKLFPGFDEFTSQDVEGDVSPEEAVPYFNQALPVFGLIEKGWTVELDEGTAVRTQGPLKKILIGRNRKAFSPANVKGVAVHEAIHALRHQNAIEQTDPLKQRAFPGNLAAEEGIATSIEQIATGLRRAVGESYYMSLGLQMNLDTLDTGRRDFRQTYEIMWRRLLLQAADHEITDEAILEAQKAAYQTVLRTTRGNSLDARDISYFEGSRKANQWFNEIAMLPELERLAKLMWMLSGNFDPTNPVQGEIFDEVRQPN